MHLIYTRNMKHIKLLKLFSLIIRSKYPHSFRYHSTTKQTHATKQKARLSVQQLSSDSLSTARNTQHHGTVQCQVATTPDRQTVDRPIIARTRQTSAARKWLVSEITQTVTASERASERTKNQFSCSSACACAAVAGTDRDTWRRHENSV